MKYINPKSIRGLVNKLADFIVSELSKEKNLSSVINVTYLESFFVINGVTESDKVVDITTIKDKFFENNKKLLEVLGVKQTNTIDIIKYNTKPETPSNQFFEFYNSERPLFKTDVTTLSKRIDVDFNSIYFTDKIVVESMFEVPNCVNINPDLIVSSEFPYGYSLNTNRSHLYYFEYISTHLFKTSIVNNILFNYKSNNTGDIDDLITIKTDSIYGDDYLKSLVLDVFDFNFEKFVSENLKDFDFTNEIDSQLDKKPWFEVDKMSDLVLF